MTTTTKIKKTWSSIDVDQEKTIDLDEKRKILLEIRVFLEKSKYQFKGNVLWEYFYGDTYSSDFLTSHPQNTQSNQGMVKSFFSAIEDGFSSRKKRFQIVIETID